MRHSLVGLLPAGARHESPGGSFILDGLGGEFGAFVPRGEVFGAHVVTARPGAVHEEVIKDSGVNQEGLKDGVSCVLR